MFSISWIFLFSLSAYFFFSVPVLVCYSFLTPLFMLFSLLSLSLFCPFVFRFSLLILVSLTILFQSVLSSPIFTCSLQDVQIPAARSPFLCHMCIQTWHLMGPIPLFLLPSAVFLVPLSCPLLYRFRSFCWSFLSAFLHVHISSPCPLQCLFPSLLPLWQNLLVASKSNSSSKQTKKNMSQVTCHVFTLQL